MDDSKSTYDSVKEPRSNRRIVFMSIFFTTIVMLIPVLYLFLRGPGPQSVSRISGRVLDDKSQPLQGAQVVLSSADSGTLLVTYADQGGIFFVPVKGVIRKAVVRINAVGYESLEKEVELGRGTEFVEIHLTRAVESVRPPELPRQQIDDSGWVSSGAGANFSDWYRVCSKPAPDGFRVASSTFRLEGDRLCNAFSECQEDPRTDKQVCWRFRLQGHSESIFQNQGRAMSRGILQTTLEPVQTGEGQGNRYGVVYIQFSGEENRRLAEQLREELVKSGYRSSGVQRIDFEFTGGVKYFNDADAKNAAELAGFVNSFLNAHSSHPLQMSPVRAASEASVPAGQMEVWLALKPVPEIQSHVEPTQKVAKYAQRPGCECGPNTIDVSPSSLEGKIGEELGFTYDASYICRYQTIAQNGGTVWWDGKTADKLPDLQGIARVRYPRSGHYVVELEYHGSCSDVSPGCQYPGRSCSASGTVVINVK